jgi:hypothetical protein
MFAYLQNRPPQCTPAESLRKPGMVRCAHRRASRSTISDYPPGIFRKAVTIAARTLRLSFVHAYTHTHTHTYIYIHTHTYIYIFYPHIVHINN